MNDSDLLVWTLESEISQLRKRVIKLEEEVSFITYERDALQAEVDFLRHWTDLDLDEAWGGANA